MKLQEQEPPVIFGVYLFCCSRHMLQAKQNQALYCLKGKYFRENLIWRMAETFFFAEFNFADGKFG